MALIPTVIERANSQTTTLYILEETTGVYDASTNPGGYGAPNVVKADMATHIFVYREYETIADVLITVDNSSSDTDVAWNVTTSEGFGLYGRAAIIAPIYNGANANWDTNDIIWESGILYHYYATPGNTSHQPSISPSKWRPHTDPLFPLLDIIENIGSYQDAYIANIANVFTKPIEECLVDKLSEHEQNPLNDSLKKDITEIKFQLDAIDIYMSAGNTLEAERSAQVANDLCENIITF